VALDIEHICPQLGKYTPTVFLTFGIPQQKYKPHISVPMSALISTAALSHSVINHKTDETSNNSVIHNAGNNHSIPNKRAANH
jgi:hypothetical protein